MNAAAPALYEPMLERDVDAIRSSAASFAADEGLDQLFLAVARFAVLAYAPSQHGKHAVISALSAHELRDERWLELITEVALYASLARQPWSEPPILEMPALDDSQRGDIGELREAMVSQDRPRAERWLAKRIDDPLPDLFQVASEDADDFGHKLVMAVTAWRLAAILGEKGRFAALRVAMWEMTAYHGRLRPGPAEPLETLMARCVEERGSIESAHAVFLFEAQTRAAEISSPASRPPDRRRSTPVYALGRDYAQTLEAHAVVRRLEPRFPDARFDDFLAAVHQNLESSPSFEEWSLA